MERILTVEQMQSADVFTIEKLGFSRETLIERAGMCVASVINDKFYGGRVLVCVGKGNNGEDGRIVAKALSRLHGFNVVTLNVFNGIFKLLDNEYDIIVDCIFGIGLNREVEGKYKTAIEKINNSGAYIISCDIPSGLNGNTGKPMGIAVKANMTVAIQEYKLGHFLNEGLDYCGELVAKDIGISIWEDDYCQKLTDLDVKKFFVPSDRKVNKGNFPKTIIIGGSKQYSGSALLSLNALSAMKMGNGYSYLGVPSCLFNAVVGLNPECIITELPEVNGGLSFDENAFSKLLNLDSIAFGMGVGVSEEIYKIISYLLANYTGKLLLDADALNTISKYGVDILKDKKCQLAITPHVAEFARLLGVDKSEIIQNSIEFAKNFALEYNLTLNLKNAVSVITDGKQVIINSTGCSGMAKAGSGDVLSGVTAGLLAKDEDCLDAVSASAYLFGKAGEIAQKSQTEFALTPSDIVRALPLAIKEIIKA